MHGVLDSTTNQVRRWSVTHGPMESKLEYDQEARSDENEGREIRQDGEYSKQSTLRSSLPRIEIKNERSGTQLVRT